MIYTPLQSWDTELFTCHLVLCSDNDTTVHECTSELLLETDCIQLNPKLHTSHNQPDISTKDILHLCQQQNNHQSTVFTYLQQATPAPFVICWHMHQNASKEVFESAMNFLLIEQRAGWERYPWNQLNGKRKKDKDQIPQKTSVFLCICLFVWGLTALSAQIGYIAP